MADNGKFANPREKHRYNSERHGLGRLGILFIGRKPCQLKGQLFRTGEHCVKGGQGYRLYEAMTVPSAFKLKLFPSV